MFPTNFIEKSLRKPEFVGGVAVTLGDGQDWFLAVPIVNFRPRRTETGGWSFGVRELEWPRGRPLEPLIDAMLEAEGIEQLYIILEIAVELLAVNYDLDDSVIARLLPFRPADDANHEMWIAIAKVAQGSTDRPKP
jgi:hypothetical protein